MAVTLTGTTGNDTLFGNTAQASLVNGLDGDDRLLSDFSNSTLNGGKGNDLLQVDAVDGSTVNMNPGQGNDTISISGFNTVGTLNVAVNPNVATAFNLGADIINLNASRGSTILSGTINGGGGKDVLNVGAGIDLTNAFIGLNQDADSVAISAVTAETFSNSKIGMGAGADSASISSNTALIFNNFTLAGGKGADTLQFGVSALDMSGTNLFSMGGGSDIVSATFGGTGINSGSFLLRGDTGTDTIVVDFGIAVTGTNNYKFSIFGDDTQAATAAFNDLITFDLTETAIDITGTIAGGGGADTINITSTQTASTAGFYVDGGFGADVIKLAGGAFAGTMAGGAGADSLSVELGTNSGFVNLSGINNMTLVGGAGNDTFLNTSMGTAVTEVNSSFSVTALNVTLGDFTTGDLFQLLVMKVSNGDANVQRSAFFTSTFTAYTGAAGVGLTGAANNNIALFQEGDDVVLQILNGSGQLSGISAVTASSVGMGVIRFKGNSAFGSSVAGASGQLSAISFTYTQSLNGATFNFT